MKWGYAAVLTLFAGIVLFYKWSTLKKQPTKDRWIFLILTIAVWILAILLIFFPEMPGPTEAIDAVFQPFGRWLEK